MAPRIRYGLIVGGIGLVINALISVLVGICGPFVTMLAGALAGWLATRSGGEAIRSKQTTNGAIAGAITGSLMMIGQIIGGIAAIMLIQAMGSQPLFGSLPSNDAEQVGYVVGGVIAGFCFGIFGIMLGAGAGAGVGYLTWKAPTPAPYTPEPPSMSTPTE
ncbi:MAG: hypothetical protein Fur005_44050 [Roseiflexaceae bacterium]